MNVQSLMEELKEFERTFQDAEKKLLGQYRHFYPDSEMLTACKRALSSIRNDQQQLETCDAFRKTKNRDNSSSRNFGKGQHEETDDQQTKRGKKSRQMLRRLRQLDRYLTALCAQYTSANAKMGGGRSSITVDLQPVTEWLLHKEAKFEQARKRQEWEAVEASIDGEVVQQQLQESETEHFALEEDLVHCNRLLAEEEEAVERYILDLETLDDAASKIENDGLEKKDELTLLYQDAKRGVDDQYESALTSIQKERDGLLEQLAKEKEDLFLLNGDLEKQYDEQPLAQELHQLETVELASLKEQLVRAMAGSS